MKICVYTLGCKVNRYESDCIISALRQKGYEVTDSLEPCDKYIINTCAVTKEAERKSRQVITKINKLSADADIYVIGCASQYDAQSFYKKGNVKYICGTEGKTDILNILDKEGVNVSELSDKYCDSFNESGFAPLSTRAFVKIQDGCDSFCSYCIIPHLRGRSRSRSPESIRREILSLSGSVKEIVLSGINISDYGREYGGLSGLLEFLSDIEIRIRLGSLENGVIDDKLILATKKLINFCPHFHLSLQSGSDGVLKSMNRHYGAKDFLSSVEIIRKHYPHAAVTTDIICGFPTETQADFEKTVKVCLDAKFADIHIFSYSKREGTNAAKLGEIGKDVIYQRVEELKALKLRLKAEFARQNLGEIRQLLTETVNQGYTEGYTENYLKVYVKGGLELNSLFKIRVGKAFKDGAAAAIID